MQDRKLKKKKKGGGWRTGSRLDKERRMSDVHTKCQEEKVSWSEEAAPLNPSKHHGCRDRNEVSLFLTLGIKNNFFDVWGSNTASSFLNKQTRKKWKRKKIWRNYLIYLLVNVCGAMIYQGLAICTVGAWKTFRKELWRLLIPRGKTIIDSSGSLTPPCYCKLANRYQNSCIQYSSYAPGGGSFVPISMLARWSSDSGDSKTQFSFWSDSY